MLKQLQNGGLKELCSQSIKKTRQILNAIYENLHRLKDRVPDFLVNLKNRISAILRALDECANRLNAMFSRFFDELAEKLKRAMGGKSDLALEGVPNSTVTYKQVKQEPPVFKVEEVAENRYIESSNGINAQKQTGGRELEYWDFDGAEKSYDAIRSSSVDVSKIANNTGMKKFHVKRIKDHLFYQKHRLDDGVRRFDADPQIANAWKRLENGDFSQRISSY